MFPAGGEIGILVGRSFGRHILTRITDLRRRLMDYRLAVYERFPNHQGPRVWEWRHSVRLAARPRAPQTAATSFQFKISISTGVSSGATLPRGTLRCNHAYLHPVLIHVLNMHNTETLFFFHIELMCVVLWWQLPIPVCGEDSRLPAIFALAVLASVW